MESPRNLTLLAEIEKQSYSRWDDAKDKIMKGGFVLTFIPIFFAIYKMFEGLFISIENKKLLRPDFKGPEQKDLYWIGVFLPLIYLGHNLTHICFKGFYRKWLPKCDSQLELQAQINTYTSNIFRFLFFTLSSIYGYVTLFENGYFNDGSSNLYHTDSMFNYWKDWPFSMILEKTKYYTLLNLSYHIERAIATLVQRPKEDFIEILTHHFMATLLIAITFFSGYSNVNIPVMLFITH